MRFNNLQTNAFTSKPNRYEQKTFGRREKTLRSIWIISSQLGGGEGCGEDLEDGDVEVLDKPEFAELFIRKH